MGMRVVRSDDRQWDNKDGGEGFVGTVVGGQDGGKNTVDMIWDTGVRAKYDRDYLRVLDNGPTGSVSS